MTKTVDLYKSRNSLKTFPDSPNTAVFTTKFVIYERNEITRVTHEIEDGAWQFFSDDKFDDFETIAKVVGLQEIIDIDNSVLEIADLPLGYSASRKNKADKWQIQKNS